MSVSLNENLDLDIQLRRRDFTLRVTEQIPLQGVTAIFGPSGSGKTTLLRAIAGFEPAVSGNINCAGVDWLRSDLCLHAHQRPVGMVFQDGRLFTHLSVAGNLEFALRRSPQGRRAIGYEEVLATFDLQPLIKRNPSQLSGGERQRVAIARTLLSQPELLLLDEPLAALDAARKAEILPYLEVLSRHFEIPVFYVSHAIDEVARLADRVIVLEGGSVIGQGKPAQVLNNPAMQAAVSAFEVISVLEATVEEQLQELHLTRLSHHGQTIVVPELGGHTVGDSVLLNVRAGDVALATVRPEALSFRNMLQGNIVAIDNQTEGAFAMLSIDVSGTTVRSQVTRHAVRDLQLEIGMPVYALLKTATFGQRR